MDDPMSSEFRRVSAERRVARLEERIVRLEELLASSRGQCARLIQDNKELRAALAGKN